MSKALADILGDKWDEPPEIATIKQFVRDKYRVSVQVIAQPQQFVIVTSNAGLAGALRPDLLAIQKAAKTNKKLLIRIGQNR